MTGVRNVTIGVVHGFDESTQRSYSLLASMICPAELR